MEKLFNMKEMINNLVSKISALCLPSKIYLVLGLFLILVTLGNTKKTILGKIFYISYIGLIAFIFDILCKSGYEFIVWLLLILPFIIIPLMLSMTTINLYRVINKAKKMKKNKN